MSNRILVVEDQADKRQIIRDMLAPTAESVRSEGELEAAIWPHFQMKLVIQLGRRAA